MTVLRLFALAALTLAHAACSGADDAGDQGAVPVSAATATATVLMYQEQEAGTDSYPVRMIVTPGYLRIDDGYAESDFALLERTTRTVFSVSHEDQSILVIQHSSEQPELPPGIRMEVEEEEDPAAPEVAGTRPVHLRFITNDTVCHEAMVVPGLLGQALAGLVEYEQTLASRQQENLAATPESVQTPCFLVRYVYAPARHLQRGFPIQEWDSDGYRRFLTDYRETDQVRGELFHLPEGYRRFSLGETSGL